MTGWVAADAGAVGVGEQDLRAAAVEFRHRTPAPSIACFSKRLLDIVSIFNKVKREHMTSMTRQYSSATSRARSAVDKTADFWAQGARTLTDRLPGLPQIDLIPAVERPASATRT